MWSDSFACINISEDWLFYYSKQYFHTFLIVFAFNLYTKLCSMLYAFENVPYFHCRGGREAFLLCTKSFSACCANIYHSAQCNYKDISNLSLHFKSHIPRNFYIFREYESEFMRFEINIYKWRHDYSIQQSEIKRCNWNKLNNYTVIVSRLFEK